MIKGKTYRFDGNLYQITYVSSNDGATNFDVIIAHTMSDAVDTIETTGGRPLQAKELARPTNLRFAYGYSPDFWMSNNEAKDDIQD